MYAATMADDASGSITSRVRALAAAVILALMVVVVLTGAFRGEFAGEVILGILSGTLLLLLGIEAGRIFINRP